MQDLAPLPPQPAGSSRCTRLRDLAMTATMRCGIEFEYLLLDLGGATPGRVRDFRNLAFAEIAPLLEDKPGRGDPSLAAGDLGIRSGYWYLEGDERFHPDGRFRTLMVKGVEIRTPPAPDIEQAIDRLLAIEAQLTARLARSGLGFGIAAFNPVRRRYDFEPPLNAWERALRADDRGYDGSEISTLTYGPDINLSRPGWHPEQCLDAARKLNAYAPFIVPFSFSSPFYAGAPWGGLSKRTLERAALRPAVKLYLPAARLAEQDAGPLVHPARLPGEFGRIEFKAFDAMPTRHLLAACCHLIEGICLAADLPARHEATDLGTYQRAARLGFDDASVRAGSEEVLAKATQALRQARHYLGAEALSWLAERLAQRRTPAHDLLDGYRQTGLMVRPGGLLASASTEPVTSPPV